MQMESMLYILIIECEKRSCQVCFTWNHSRSNGRRFPTQQEWATASPSDRLLERDAKLLIDIADMFDYCIIFYSGVYRPDHEAYVDGIRALRELDGGRHLLMAHGDTTMSIPDGERMFEVVYRLVDKRDEVLQEETRKVDEALQLAPDLLDA